MMKLLTKIKQFFCKHEYGIIVYEGKPFEKLGMNFTRDSDLTFLHRKCAECGKILMTTEVEMVFGESSLEPYEEERP